jgi:broad specificity phosphatase PhoE
MTTRLLLIRHGQTAWNAEHRWQGHADVPLSEVGLGQAQALANRLRNSSVNALYSSDLRRAAQTAGVLGHAWGLPPVFDPAWRERDVGIFSGLTHGEILDRYPHAWAEMRSGRLNPPEGEDHLIFHRRVTTAYDQVLANHVGQTVAVVSHGGAIATLVAHVLGLEPGNKRHFTLRGNTGLTIIEVAEDGPLLTLLNDTCHLD